MRHCFLHLSAINKTIIILYNSAGCCCNLWSGTVISELFKLVKCFRHNADNYTGYNKNIIVTSSAKRYLMEEQCHPRSAVFICL